MIKSKAVKLLAALALGSIGIGAAQAAPSGTQTGAGTFNIDLPSRGVTARVVVNAIGGAVDIDTATGNFKSTGGIVCNNGNNSATFRNGTSAVNDGDIILGCDFLVPALSMTGILQNR